MTDITTDVAKRLCGQKSICRHTFVR